MKKLVFISASVLSVLFASQAFSFSENTVTFQGEVPLKPVLSGFVK